MTLTDFESVLVIWRERGTYLSLWGIPLTSKLSCMNKGKDIPKQTEIEKNQHHLFGIK